MMMCNGIGAFLGAQVSGWLIDHFFTRDGNRDWHHIWLSFASYAMVIAISFAVLFRHKQNSKE